MKVNVGAMVTLVCREGQCHQCRGHEFTMSADLPYECEHYCHDEPPACLDDADDLGHYPPAAENTGDAIRHERNDS